MIVITEQEVDPGETYKRLSRKASGSVVVHFAVVKGMAEGAQTTGIKFAVDGDLEGELNELEQRLRSKWKVEDVVIIRRLGELVVGDIILAAGVSAEGREDAFGACQDAISACKKLRHLKKTELFINRK